MLAAPVTAFRGLLGAGLGGWVWHYAEFYPTTNFLWTCNVGLVVGVLGVVFRWPLLVSMALVFTLIPDLLWVVDVVGRFATGAHPIGGTEYMFDSAIPLSVRALSWEHALLPLLLIGALLWLGYDRRAWLCCAPCALVAYYLSYWLADPATGVNWVWGPFGVTQSFMPAWLYPALAATVYWFVLTGPVHLAASRWLPPARRPTNAPLAA
ncbi:MAG: hypothetical protein AAFZ58_14765 [Pseudomonadota bacterium]